MALGRTVDEIEGAMTAQEFGEWMAFYSMHPFGPAGDWFRSGVIASTIANVNRGRDVDPYVPADFMPKATRDETPVEDDPTEFFKAI